MHDVLMLLQMTDDGRLAVKTCVGWADVLLCYFLFIAHF